MNERAGMADAGLPCYGCGCWCQRRCRVAVVLQNSLLLA